MTKVCYSLLGVTMSDKQQTQLIKCLDPKWYGNVMRSIGTAVTRSFQEDLKAQQNALIITPNGSTTAFSKLEAARRIEICMGGALIMRKDLGFSCPQIIDHIHGYLRSILDKGEWVEPKVTDKWAAESRGDFEIDDTQIVSESESTDLNL